MSKCKSLFSKVPRLKRAMLLCGPTILKRATLGFDYPSSPRPTFLEELRPLLITSFLVRRGPDRCIASRQYSYLT